MRTRGVFTHRDDFLGPACVERGLVRPGISPISNPGVSLFWQFCYHLASHPAPQLRLRHPPLPGVSLFRGNRCYLSGRPAPRPRLRHPSSPGVSLIWRNRCHLSGRPVPQPRLRHPPAPGVSLIGRIRCHLSGRPASQPRPRHPSSPGVSLIGRNRCYLGCLAVQILCRPSEGKATEYLFLCRTNRKPQKITCDLTLLFSA